MWRWAKIRGTISSRFHDLQRHHFLPQHWNLLLLLLLFFVEKVDVVNGCGKESKKEFRQLSVVGVLTGLSGRIFSSHFSAAPWPCWSSALPLQTQTAAGRSALWTGGHRSLSEVGLKREKALKRKEILWCISGRSKSFSIFIWPWWRPVASARPACALVSVDLCTSLCTTARVCNHCLRHLFKIRSRLNVHVTHRLIVNEINKMLNWKASNTKQNVCKF